MRRLYSLSFATIVVLASISSAPAQEQCKECLRNELAGLGQQTVAAAALGAIGGLHAGAVPGAVCGAILAAVGVNVVTLINVANKCEQVCTRSAAGREPASVQQCRDFVRRANGR